MPVSVVRVPQDFVMFLNIKLGEKFRLVEKDAISVTFARLGGFSFRVHLREGKASGAYFCPAEDGALPFSTAVYEDHPKKAVLDLTGYTEVPEYLQVLVDEYIAMNPEIELEVRLAPEASKKDI